MSVILLSLFRPFFIQYRIDAGVLIPWCPVRMTYKRYELFHTSLIPHSEAFTQSFRPQVIVLYKSVNTSCVCFTEKIIQKLRCSLVRQTFTLEALVEVPAYTKCIGIFTQGENITNDEIVFLQTHGIA